MRKNKIDHSAGALKVLHASYARGAVRGGERQLILLVNELSRRGVEQAVICRSVGGLNDEFIRIPGVDLLSARSHVIDWLTYGRASLLHAHEARAAYWAGFRGNLTGTPYIVTRRVINRLSTSPMTGFVYRHANAIVGVSEAVCRLTGDDCGRSGIRIYDAHQGLAPNPENVARIRAELGGSPLVGQVAALVDARKGQSASIAAFAIIKERFASARLVLLGTGPDEARLKQTAAGTEGVIFAGYRGDIADWMAALDLVIHPSTRGALESSLLDAMHLGIPIVANRVGGIPEIARHEETALLVELGDVSGLAASAIRVLADNDLRQRIVVGGRRFADTLSPAAMADAYMQLYGEIISAGRRRLP